MTAGPWPPTRTWIVAPVVLISSGWKLAGNGGTPAGIRHIISGSVQSVNHTATGDDSDDLRHGVAMDVYGEHGDLEKARALVGQRTLPFVVVLAHTLRRTRNPGLGADQEAR